MLRKEIENLITPLTVPLTQGEVSKLEYQADVINQDTMMFVDNFEYGYYRDTDPNDEPGFSPDYTEGVVAVKELKNKTYKMEKEGLWNKYYNGKIEDQYPGFSKPGSSGFINFWSGQ